MLVLNIPFQSASEDVYNSKYNLKNKQGRSVDGNLYGTLERVAKALAKHEKDHDYWSGEFMWAMLNGAIPAGRITSNAGAEKYKPSTSLINCVVSAEVADSIEGIGKGVYEAGITLSAGCGIGYEFSTLRPKGAHVNGVGAKTSGPLPFMDVYDKMCFTVASAGGRRGAQMATFDIRHPDVIDFIKAKREDGRFRQFNVSVLVTKDFLKAVENDSDWNLIFPIRGTELDLVDKDALVWEPWHVRDPAYTVNDQGLVLCKVYGTVKARELWDMIAGSAYDYAEPGVIFVDVLNEYNNLWFAENLRSTNPCGEQPLPPYGACLLGSINLTHFVKHPFKDDASFDMDTYIKVIRIFTRMLDNVVEMNGLPLEKQRQEIFRKRRHGMGITGLGSAMTMMGIRYGSPTAIAMTDELTKVLAVEGWKVGVELAKEKGAAPIMDETFKVTTEMLAHRPEMRDDGFELGTEVSGKVLMARYSRYIRTLRTEDMGGDFWEDFEKYGSRFSHHTSIAPTGTISLSIGNNISNGIEPSFAHHYQRNLTVEGRKTRQQTDVYSFELLAYRHFVDPNAMPGLTNGSSLPDCFVTADDIHWKEHLDMQCAAQKWIDSSISKTINVPTKISLSDFKDVYTYAASRGAKGTAVFRYNPETLQGVLVRNEDLKSTRYQFKMADGSVLEVFGNEKVEYDGEVHAAANLYDAMKEHVYGRF